MAANLGMGPVAVLLPVKAFSDAKLRLASALDPAQRRALARAMATHVLEAARPLPVAVVCDDTEVADWARDHHALVVWEPERGLNRAVEAGVDRLAAEGARRVVVAHADLALARDLGWVGAFADITLVPDSRDDGTNVACVPVGTGFTFSYGPGSFARHGAEARRLGLALRVVREPRLGRDVDLPSDLAMARGETKEPAGSGSPLEAAGVVPGLASASLPLARDSVRRTGVPAAKER